MLLKTIILTAFSGVQNVSAKPFFYMQTSWLQSQRECHLHQRTSVDRLETEDTTVRVQVEINLILNET